MSSRCASYEILTRADGAVDIAVTTSTGLIFKRRDLACHAEASAALEDLRVILAALGCDLIRSGGPALA